MRSAIFAAAFLIGGGAFAQDTGTADDPTIQGSQTVAPSNANPETDARGVTVVSAPAEVPQGANQSATIAPGSVFTPNPNQGQVFTPRPSTETYPACSRTVTDNCVQGYVRGSRSPG